VPDNYLNLKALKDFSRFLHGEWGKEIVLADLVQVFHFTIGCKRVSAYLFEEGNFVLKAQIGETINLDSPEILKESQTMISVFNCKDGICEPTVLRGNELCVIPIMCGEETFGLVLYELPVGFHGRTDMVSIMMTLTSAALKNISLAEGKEVIDDIVLTFASGLDMQIYYPQFAYKLRKIVNFDKLTISIPDPFNAEKLVVYAEDADNPLETRTIGIAGTAPAWVISTGKPIIEDDLAAGKMFSEDRFLLDQGIRCALRLPLISKGAVIGTLNMGSRVPAAYKQRDIELLMEIADRIGPAVENALIYETINNKLGFALMQLEDTFSATLNALTVLLDRRDAGTKGHSLRVVRYAAAIAVNMGLGGAELENIRLGSLLHDIGKIGIPDSILFKPGKLTDEEWVVMRTHPQLGADMVSRIEFLKPAVPIVLHHHEWFNGNGYPDGLAGEGIPLGARIFSVADAFDAMTSSRPYRDALSVDVAINGLKECIGTQFCPECIEAFLQISIDELYSIYDDCATDVTFKSPYMIGKEFVEARRANK